jgi:hypothetical protein
MVDTHDTAYAIFDVQNKSIVVKGFGREKDRILQLR